MDVLKVTDVIQHFNSFIDTVLYKKPVVFEHNHDYILSFSTEQINIMLEDYRFRTESFRESDGTTTVAAEGFDLVANAIDYKQAVEKLAAELIDYAHDYFEQFPLYFKSTNREKHFPYILKVVLAKDIQEVISFIDAPS